MYSPENDNDNTVGKRSIPPSDQITNSQEQDTDGEHSDIEEEKDKFDLELKIDRDKNGHDEKTDGTIDVGSGEKSSSITNRDETSDSESTSVASGDAHQNTTCGESLSEDDNEKDDSSIPRLDTGEQSPNKASQKSDDLEDAEKYMRCLVCGPAKDTPNKEYTKLSSCPDIEKEIHDLLKILSPPDDMDVCCDRCLGFMKIFITLKNDFLNMRRKIIALHIDAQLELPENDRYDESEAEGVDNDMSDTEDRRCKSKKLDQHSDVIIKHEIIDVDFEEDKDSTKEDKRRAKGRITRRRKIFKCRHCNKSYTRRYDLKIHQRIHTGERPVKCQYCDRSFHSKNICLQHEKKHMEKPFMCKTCFRYFSTKEECEEHETTHTAPRPFNCQYCNRTFERKNEWLVHERTHTGERPFKCERCEKSFFSKSARLKHEKAKHKDLITARKRTAETKKYDYIEITDSEKVTYKCAHCDRTFTRKDAIILHERTHTGERPFKCKYCSKSFCGKSSCVKHEREKHRGAVSNKENGAETNMDDNCEEKQVYLDGRLKCERCDKSFNKKGDLFEHDKVHEFKCSHCGKSCWGKKALYKHERIHSGGKPHKCKTCDKSFAYKASLEEHERIHTGEKPFLCQYCTRSFTQSSTLKLHERTQHTGEKPYKCRYCEQGFPTRLACEEHERFHTGEKPFKCDFCDKRFVRKSNWRDHVKTHLGLKPQVCSYCGKGFRDRSTLGRHERTHTGERPYRCQYCDKTFVRKNYCNIHEKTHTGEKPVKNQQSNNKLKSPTRAQKSPPQPDFTRKVDHTEGSSWGHPSNNTSYVRHQVENTYGPHGQHSNSTFMTGPPESNFRTGPPDNTYRPPNAEISYRGPHSNNVFPTPEAVYPGDNTNPYMYSMYMPGM